jgi:hypothetical protein
VVDRRHDEIAARLLHVRRIAVDRRRVGIAAPLDPRVVEAADGHPDRRVDRPLDENRFVDGVEDLSL